MTRGFGVLFDFDGVILDSEMPEYEAHRQIFAGCGTELTLEQWCGQVGTWPASIDWCAVLVERTGRPYDPDTFVEERKRRFRELLLKEPKAGVRPLLEALKSAGVPLGIASTAPMRWVGPMAEELALRDFFGAIVTGDDVERRKPAPDIYLEAARRLHLAPSQCVAIEDSQTGLASARAAGMRTVVIPHTLTEFHDLTGADLRVGSAEELTVEMLRGLAGQS